MHKKIVKCNTLTICSTKDPTYYLRLIRYHFKQVSGTAQQDKILSIQALGLSCQNLVYVACLVTMKGYATYKRIKNDHLSVPIADSETGRHLGLVKKVRLTVKLLRSDNFDDIIASEEEAERKAKAREYQPTSSRSRGEDDSSKWQKSTLDSTTSEERPRLLSSLSGGLGEKSSASCAAVGLSAEFDQEDLVLKSSSQAQMDMQRYLIEQDEDLEHLLRQNGDFDCEDPNFRVNEGDLMDDDEDEDEGQEGDDQHHFG